MPCYNEPREDGSLSFSVRCSRCGVGVARGGGAGGAGCRCRAGCRRRSRSGSTTPTGWCRSGRRSSRGPGSSAPRRTSSCPPQLRAKGAQTVYFDLYLNNRVGTPSKPADPSMIQARADKLFDTAVTSSGCDHAADRRERAVRRAVADAVDADDGAVPRERARLSAASRRRAARGRSCSSRTARTPTTRPPTTGGGRRRRSRTSSRRSTSPGRPISKQGAVAGSRRLRATMRTRMEDLIQIGVPTNRLGMMLTFSSTPQGGRPRGPAAARSGSTSSSGRRSRRSRSRRSCTSRASGRGAGRPSTRPATTPTSRRPRARGSGRATTRSATRPRSRARSSTRRSTSGDALPAGTLCLLGTTQLLASDVAALTRLTGDRDLAFSAELQHAVLVEAQPVADEAVRAGGGRRDPRPLRRQPGGVPRGARAREGHAGARAADPRRRAAPPRGRGDAARACADRRRSSQEWYATYAAMPARAGARDRSRAVARQRAQRASRSQASRRGGCFALAAGASGEDRRASQVTALGETAPLGSFPFAQAAPAVRTASSPRSSTRRSRSGRAGAQNQRLGSLTCQHDQPPQPATVDLTDWLPYPLARLSAYGCPSVGGDACGALPSSFAR